MRKSTWILLFLAFLSFTTACSRGEFLFRFADDLAASRADKYFDLTSEQKKEFKTSVAKDIRTGKKEAFPKMAQRLRTLEKDLRQEPVQPETLKSAFAEIEKQVKDLGIYFRETGVQTALKLSKAQIDHFAEEVKDQISDEEKDPKDAVEKVEKRYRRSLEYWIGGLNRDQNKLLKDFLVKHPYPWQLQNRSQEYVVKQFVEASKKPETKKAFVEKFANDYESVRLPEYRAALQTHQTAFLNFVSQDFWNSMSPDQRKRFKENLIARAEQLERLASQP